MAAMGAKFIHPMESACPKNPVAIRNAIAAMMRRSAGIISENLSGRWDMQRELESSFRAKSRNPVALPNVTLRDLSTPLRSAQDDTLLSLSE
jgi:hypothetical protein